VLDVNIFSRTLKLAGEDGQTLTVGFAEVGFDSASGQWQMHGGA